MIDSTYSTYRTLAAWQRAVELAVSIYAVTKRFPADERFGLTQQLRRAAVSVPSNIAEGRGRGRGTRRDYRHFLLQARGSAYELETAVHIAERLGYLEDDDVGWLREATSGVIRPLNGLIKSLSD
jgi:four helix bundle protein